MKLFLLLLALVPLLAAAEPPIPPPLIERLKQATIPSFQLDQATIHEALAKLKSEWIRQHPGESFPVVLIQTETYGNPRITLDLQNAPFWTVIRAMGDSVGFAVHDAGETIRMDTDYEEDFRTQVFPVDASVVAKLGLKPDGTFKNAVAALAKFGLTFTNPSGANLSPDGSALTVRQTPGQLRLIPGILHLLTNGFIVEPPPTSAPK
jgi:hypothetical protein